MSFFSINKLDYRRSSIGASSGELQYSLNGAPFAFAASLSYPSNAVSGDSHPPIDLTGVTALQDVPEGSPVILRIVNYGAANATEPWYIYDTANSSAHDLEDPGHHLRDAHRLQRDRGWRLLLGAGHGRGNQAAGFAGARDV
jgi:hypothetical protein